MATQTAPDGPTPDQDQPAITADPATGAPVAARLLPFRQCSECSQALPLPRPGRTRLYCSDGCKRKGQDRQRKIKWRARYLITWRQLLTVPRERRVFIRQQIRELTAELEQWCTRDFIRQQIRELTAELH